MPIDVEKAMSTPMKEYEFEYTMKDVLLYALGIGAGDPPLDKNQLKFTFETDLRRCRLSASFRCTKQYPRCWGTPA